MRYTTFVSVVLFVSNSAFAQTSMQMSNGTRAWMPSFIFLGACALIIILQLFQGGYRPNSRETHDYIEEELSQYQQTQKKQPLVKH